ncbi:MAG: DUF5711 family protein [Peptostreptococcaceae bacterium]|jgi:hypothetical protein|nr:DUF5711 family protein [Peptostreptococcaceae bacterium]
MLKKIMISIMIFLMILGLISFNDKLSYQIKSRILKNSQISPKLIEQINYEYEIDTNIKQFGDGIAIYNKKELVYLNKNGVKEFSLKLDVINYEMDCSNNNVYILDKIQNKLYIVGKDAKVKEYEFRANEKPLYIEAFKDDNVAINYKVNNNMKLDSIRFVDSNANVIEDISMSSYIINIMTKDKYQNNMMVASFYHENERIVSNIAVYNSKGKMLTSSKVYDMLFSRAISNDKGFLFFEDNDGVFIDYKNYSKKNVNFNYNMRDLFSVGDRFATLDEYYNVRIYSNIKESIEDEINNRYLTKEEQEIKEKESYMQNKKTLYFNGARSILNIGDKTVINSGLSIYFLENETKIDYIKDILDIYNFSNGYFAIIFRGEIQIYALF